MVKPTHCFMSSMNVIFTLIFYFCLLLQTSHCNADKSSMGANDVSSFLRVCYYSSGDPEPIKINGTLCTHIIKGFSGIANGSLSPGTQEDLNRSIAVVNLKKIYPHLKVMLSLGGGGSDAGFSDAMSTWKNRQKLILSCIGFLKKYGFDGLDIDWEFPVWNDGVKEDRENFVHFLHEFRTTSQNLSVSLLLSVAVAGPKTIIDESYDIPTMAKYVDFINLMSYDYHDFTFYTPFTGHNSPLFNRSVEEAYFATLNTAWSASYWHHKGMPLKKIMVGLPTYGHTYTLLDPQLHGFDAPATGYGLGNGTITFPEVCKFLNSGGVRVFDIESRVPYAFRKYDWIGFDDYTSIAIKAQWVKEMGFGGVMTFDLNCDDWQGICDGKTKFPLHQILYNIFSRHNELSP